MDLQPNQTDVSGRKEAIPSVSTNIEDKEAGTELGAKNVSHDFVSPLIRATINVLIFLGGFYVLFIPSSRSDFGAQKTILLISFAFFLVSGIFAARNAATTLKRYKVFAILLLVASVVMALFMFIGQAFIGIG